MQQLFKAGNWDLSRREHELLITAMKQHQGIKRDAKIASSQTRQHSKHLEKTIECPSVKSV